MQEHDFVYSLPVQNDLSGIRAEIADFVGEENVDRVVNLVNQRNTGIDARATPKVTKKKIDRLRELLPKIAPQLEEAATLLQDRHVIDALWEASMSDDTLRTVFLKRIRKIFTYFSDRNFKHDAKLLQEALSQAETSNTNRRTAMVDRYFLDELATLIVEHKGSLHEHDYKGGGRTPNYLSRLTSILPVDMSDTLIDKYTAEHKTKKRKTKKQSTP